MACLMLAGCSGSDDMTDPSDISADVLYLYDVKTGRSKQGKTGQTAVTKASGCLFPMMYMRNFRTLNVWEHGLPSSISAQVNLKRALRTER